MWHINKYVSKIILLNIRIAFHICIPGDFYKTKYLMHCSKLQNNHYKHSVAIMILHQTCHDVSCHDANFVVTGSLIGCHNYNLQWQKRWHYDNFHFSVVSLLYYNTASALCRVTHQTVHNAMLSATVCCNYAASLLKSQIGITFHGANCYV